MDKGIKLSATKYDRVWWKQVRRWFLAPIPGYEGFVTLTLEVGGATRGGRRYWSIVLKAGEQTHACLAEIGRLRQLGRATAPVVELLRPMPQRPFSKSTLWLLAMAFGLLVHGLPLLAVGLMPHDHKDTESTSHYSPAEREKLGRVDSLSR